nr:Abi family protein [uncultured Blautia sp.]
MKEFKYIPINLQIEKLKKQGLIISDEAFAHNVLSIHGYYNVINSYREPYITTDSNGNKIFKPSVTFEQIYDLFAFDQAIRDSIMISMIDFEDHLKAVTADVIGASFGVDPKYYLARNNYRDKHVNNPKFSRNEILYTLEKAAKFSSKEPLKYYREKYNLVPPWILFKGVFFATIVNFIRFLKKDEREALILQLYKGNVTDDNMEQYKDLLSDTLFMCLDYRNQTAHGGRIYNFTPKYTLRPFNGISHEPGLPQLVFALKQLNYKVPVLQIQQAISVSINDYCNAHHSEEDVKRIEQVTGFKVTRKVYVWCNPKTHIYHVDNHCSGSNALEKTLMSKALEDGFLPCKRCCKEIISQKNQ